VKGRHLIAAVIVLALAGAALSFGFGVNHQPAVPPGVPATPEISAAAKATASVLDPAQVSGVPEIDPHRAFGSKSAPIAMEVFSDFQCPACKQLYKTTNQQLLDNYVNTNKVYLVHRDFPLPMHAHSRVAARYVRAAAQLGKGEQAEQALFQNQEKWEQSGDVDGTLAAVLSAADMTKIRAQAKGTALDAGIDKDVALGKTYNVNQTPTTIIHFKGQTYPVVGIVSYDVLHQFLDQLLSQR
jgi:protein-disulfide isomerase